MANYGYIKLPRRITDGAAEDLIATAVRACLDPRWQVMRPPRGVWLVYLPGTEKRGREASAAVLADGDPVGFVVELQRHERAQRLAFRHGPNRFERWAQGCVEEQLADIIGVGVLYDATDEIKPPGTRQYRTGKTYREHLAAKLMVDGKLSEADEAWIESQMYCVPDGHR